MNDKDKLISFINKGKENNPVKEVHVIKDSDTENHILLVNEDGTSIASNKWEVASGGSNEEILELNEIDMSAILQAFSGEIERGVRNFSTIYAVKDYSKVKIEMSGIMYYMNVSNKTYMPNSQIQFDLFQNYNYQVDDATSLDYIRIRISLNKENSTYDCRSFRLTTIN